MSQAIETIRIVIVEDHQTTLDGLKRQLDEEPDFEVVGVAADAAAGLDISRSLAPDVIVLDLHLPKSRGPKSMVEAYCSLGSKVLVLSGENRFALVKAVMHAGAAVYIVKSESLSTVCQAIRLARTADRPLIFGKLSHVPPTQFSASEQVILKLLARGMKYEDIAMARTTAPATVKKQCERLRLKLNLENREQLIAWAINSGFANLEVD